MTNVGQQTPAWPASAVIFGASGGIGAALGRALLERGCNKVFAGSRGGSVALGTGIDQFRFDLSDEASIAAAAAQVSEHQPDLIIAATGVLTLEDGSGPERSYKMLESDVMKQTFLLNTIGPAMVAKHFLPLMPRDRRAIFAALSARVGSISDNRLGGWHSYRASKAALNMLLKNFAIELGRTHKQAVVAGLHPGTVDSDLSKPFQNNLPDGQLTTPEDAASNLLGVLDGLSQEDSGGVFDFAGTRVPE